MEKGTSRLYACYLCKEKFSFEGIKYTKDGKNIVCINCYNKLQKKDNKKGEEYKTANPPSANIKLICIDCNYRFSLKKKSKVNLRCPYCSGTRLIKDEITADKLLEEVSENKNIK